MKKNFLIALSAFILVGSLTLASIGLARAATKSMSAIGGQPAGQNKAFVQASSVNGETSKMVETQSTPNPTLEPTQEASGTPEAGNSEAENADDSNETDENENAVTRPDSLSGNSLSEDGSAGGISNSDFASPVTRIANPFSSDSSAERLLKSGSARSTTRTTPSIANPFSSESATGNGNR